MPNNAFKMEDWLPMSPEMGPPLPRFFQIFWPWYEEEPEEEYICPHCGAAFATYEQLAAHIQAQHPGAYICTYCGATFDTYEELVAHVTSMHPGERIPIDIIWT